MPDHPLYERLLKLPNASSDAILDAFLSHVTARNLSLYPAQEEAVLELLEGKNVILNTPTGSGKSLVAEAFHFQCTARGLRSVYTCPIKALVNEKFLALCRTFGPSNVGMATGDATVNRDAPILCCTAEVLANLALRHGPNTGFSAVIMDEFHYYSDRERGVAWQVPLLTMPNARFLLMSATLGATDFFAEQLTKLTGAESVIIRSGERPVPLSFEYAETPITETLENLRATNKFPVYLVHFTQNEAVQSAQNCLSLNVCTKEEKGVLAESLHGIKFTTPFGKEIQKFLKNGIGVHHAGLLPKYRILVEQLAQKGLLKIICGTDTLGVGVNVPIRSVLFTQLCKFDGQKTGIMNVRDFHQIAGRAGRRGYDDRGWVIIQAPEHVIENLKLAQKAERDGKKNFVKRKPPEQNFVGWNEETFQRLLTAPPEALVSRFQVTHGMLLSVLSREHEDGCKAMQKLIRACHDTDRAKQQHRKRAWQLFRSLVERQIIEFTKDRSPGARKLRINVALQDDFSLNEALSLYLIDTIKLVDPASAEYPLVLLTLVESILENPELILRRQLDKLKTQKMAEMKEQGVPYEERLAKLEEMEYPKPNRDFVYSTFNAFAAAHPWVGQENIRPKSIAREMYENFRSFNDYVKDYELGRAEGLLLRHLSSVYKTLSQTVPEAAKTEPVQEMELYFAALLKQVDSSLLEEWERLQDPDAYEAAAAAREATGKASVVPVKVDITRNTHDFKRQCHQQILGFLAAFARGDDESALNWLGELTKPEGGEWTAADLTKAGEAHAENHERVCLDPEARNAKHTLFKPPETENAGVWLVEQILVDPAGLNDWIAAFEVDLVKSRETGTPFLRLLGVKPSSER